MFTFELLVCLKHVEVVTIYTICVGKIQLQLGRYDMPISIFTLLFWKKVNEKLQLTEVFWNFCFRFRELDHELCQILDKLWRKGSVCLYQGFILNVRNRVRGESNRVQQGEVVQGEGVQGE